MRSARVYNNDVFVGEIKELDDGRYLFYYDDSYFYNTTQPAISVTMSKIKQVHVSQGLFPFFYNMLSEGANRKLQCRMHKIDEEDDFGLLLKTASHETVGAITVKEVNE